MAQAVLESLEHVMASRRSQQLILEGLKDGLRSWIKEHEAMLPPPPECQTEEEKRAYAFGWFKALETQNNKLQARLQEQEKDIEELTCACQLLLRRIKEMEDDQRRNTKALV
jgi:predicted RNase H-like nuclease (RuvC/YqgF family)